ncbi:protein of unknown function DUF218 [Sediminispirochaeta smaragdinae DSM 11293]|uniref:DUF218 domain-containing protein n=1 Tax=Sediminispirochaeta smaragdinae (strain DSM 11293 / JCM 15392 / SEBR 4228) TaxID=573413 RepID=E1RAH8_SEDSS|nr:protein of unknown function DUF218 [Sediminispirochaeta smaragdinae DSM 11293]
MNVPFSSCHCQRLEVQAILIFRFMKRKSFIVVGIAIICVFFLLLILMLFIDRSISVVARERLYDSISEVPSVKTALVLGTSRYRPGGKTNLYFRYRIEAAKALFDAGKVRYLLVSGDNARKSYNEPVEMRQALVEMGVPIDRIVLDYAGFRTLDSVVRCQEVFGQDHFIIVSQRFHNERALYIARHFGIDAVAFNAKDVGGYSGRRIRGREYFARVKALLDLHFFHTGPRFLGETVEIPE